MAIPPLEANNNEDACYMKPMMKNNALALLVTGLLTGQAMAVTSTPTATVTGHAPVLAAGKITYEDVNKNGVLDVGDIVKVDTAHDFIFSDADNDSQEPNTFSWKVGGKEVSTASTYTLQAADLGQTITLEETPHTSTASTDPAEGIATASQNTLTVSAEDEILSVDITGGSGVAGAPVVGDTLMATAACTAACGAMNYRWQVEDAVGSGKFVDIAGATSSSWQVTTATQKRRVQVDVTQKVTP